MISKEIATGFAGGAAVYGIQDILGENIDNWMTWRSETLKGFGTPSVVLKTSMGLVATGLGYYGTTGKGPLKGETAQAIALGYGLPNMFDGVLTGIRESTREAAPASMLREPARQITPRQPAAAPARQPSQVQYPPRKGLIEII